MEGTIEFEARQRLKLDATERGIDLTHLPFVMKACVAALDAHPVLNAELDEENVEVIPRHVLPISLTSDPRIVDGGDAARFTNELKRYLENPSLLLLE